MPKPKEHPVEGEDDDEPDMVVTKEDDKGELDDTKDEEAPKDEEVPEESPQ